MAQINISVDDRTAAALDRIAEERRLRRPELMRALLAEVIAAHAEGRELFAAGDGGGPELDLMALTRQLHEAVTELDRAQRDNRKQAKQMQDAWTASEEAVQAAAVRIAGQITHSYRQAIAPFYERIAEQDAALAKIPPAVATELGLPFGELHARITENNRLAAQPRIQRNLIIGRDREWLSVLAVTHAVMAGVGALMVLLICTVITPLAIEVALGVLNSDVRVCRLIKARYGASDCTVPAPNRLPASQQLDAEDRP